LKPPATSQASFHADIPDPSDDPPPPPIYVRRTGWDRFFSSDNPLWTLFPILLSVAALWFAYKSNVINREWADVHLRITTQAFMGWYMGEDFFIEDGAVYFPTVMGSLENLEDQMSTLVLATNDLGMRWLAESIGWDIDEMSVEDMNYTQYYIFMAICNDGDQIAEDLYISFDYYKVDDKEELRGDEPAPEGVEAEEWKYGPAIIPPGEWIIIPLGTCYVRLDPTSQEADVQYVGDFYNPVEMTYNSAVSGLHARPLDLESIPQTMNAFTDPPITAEEEAQEGSEERSGESKR